jgi:hypothetical protein
MFWNKKKKENKGLPDLPATPRAIPSMTDFHKMPLDTEESEEETHGLPTFPDSPMKKGFSQSAIKDAVETDEIKNDSPIPVTLPSLPNLPEESTTESPANYLPKIPQRKSKLIELEEWKPSQTPESSPSSPTIAENKPVYVRLDKFQDARESLEIVKVKLREIDQLLRTLRDVKTKEDQELSSWEKEVESIKARINSISTDIFEKTGS